MNEWLPPASYCHVAFTSYQLPAASCQLPVAAATLCQSLFLVAHSNWPGVGHWYKGFVELALAK